MGLFKIFKKKKEPQLTTVQKNELEKWIIDEKGKIKQEYITSVKTRFSELINELKEESKVLETVSLEEFKEKERIKTIVQENFNNYKIYLSRLISKLEKLEIKDGFVEEINKTFSEFKKRSSTSFEKATYLIGKEMGAVKETIRKFFQDLERILNENSENIKKSDSLEDLEKIINEKKDLNSSKKNLLLDMKSLEEEEKISKGKKEKIEEKISQIKNSESFHENEKKKKEKEEKEREQDIEIKKLSSLIDFKALTNFYHKYERDMNKIKKYKENFRSEYNNDSGEKLLNLLKEANLLTKEISQKKEKITNIKKGLEQIKIKEDGISKLQEEKNKITIHIESVSEDIESKNKVLKRIEENIDSKNSDINERLQKLDIKLNP